VFLCYPILFCQFREKDGADFGRLSHGFVIVKWLRDGEMANFVTKKCGRDSFNALSTKSYRKKLREDVLPSPAPSREFCFQKWLTIINLTSHRMKHKKMKSTLVMFCFLQLCLFEVQGLSNNAPVPKATVSDAKTITSQRESSGDAIRSDSTAPSSTAIRNVSLYSLQWTPDERISIPVRKVWKWKDNVLGDGRDFFVPKPKTIRKLQTILLNQVPGLQECSVLSNCARLEVLCAWNDEDSSITTAESRVKELSSCLLHQVNHYDTAKNQFLVSLTQSLDRPNVLSAEPTTTAIIGKEEESDIQELCRHWHAYADLSDILLHLCQISAGMASRPRRPDRQVIFRPFSSRDAHILLQLKRTKDLTSRNNGVLNQLLEYATRAGKAARNEKLVPALARLKGYGDGSSKYSSSDPPLELSEQVQQLVVEQAIRPLIQECIDKLRVASRKDSISQFRQAAEAMATTNEESILIRKLLHQPTMELRSNPDAVDVNQALQVIEKELLTFQKRWFLTLKRLEE
jgi:hypothetical protein